MAVTIHATEKALFRVLSNDYAFAVPPYQRPYAWTTEQAGELLSDLLGFLGNSSQPVEDANPYFLGSIVLIKKEDSPESDIVDGQQRLATITILLAALRTLVPPDFASGVTRFIYEAGDVIVGNPNRYRLTLRKRDEDFFRQHIQDPNGLDRLKQLNSGTLTDSQKNIQANAAYFVQAIGALSEELRVRLLQYMMRRCFLVVVSTPDLDSAYRIFTVLNARGLDLGLTDLLKSDVIGAIPHAQQEQYTEKWEGAEEDLTREAFQELFAHIRMISRKTKLRETALNEFKKHIQPHRQPTKFIDDILLPYAEALKIIKTASYQSDRNAEDVNSLLRWLNRIDNVDWVPPAIRYLSANSDFPEKLKAFFNDLERLAAGLMIARADINERIERYAKVLVAIEEQADLYAAGSPLQLTREEANLIANTLNGDVYLMTRGALYVLLRLDSVLSAGEATYDYPVVSIEHVLPQNPQPGSLWLEWFPAEEQRARYTHRIGNLVLLSRRKNSQARNYEFTYKKEKYFTTTTGVSPFALTTQVLRKGDEWTPSIIDERQTELLTRLKNLWRL